MPPVTRTVATFGAIFKLANCINLTNHMRNTPIKFIAQKSENKVYK